MNHSYNTRSKAALERRERAIKENEDQIIKEREKTVDDMIENAILISHPQALKGYLCGLVRANEIVRESYNKRVTVESIMSTVIKNFDAFLLMSDSANKYDQMLRKCDEFNNDWEYAAIFKRRLQQKMI